MSSATLSPTRSYARGARILSIGIASTGLFTFAYFAIASHVVGEVDAKRLDVLWSVMFVIVSVIYRPIEQLLSRTLAHRRALGLTAHPLRTPLALQAAFAAVFAALALAARGPLENDVFDGSSELYWVFFCGTLFYAGSYFARGWLAGHQLFGLYGGLALMESVSRFLFPLAVAAGIASGEGAVALGIAAAPLLSLIVVPLAFAHRGGWDAGGVPADPGPPGPQAAESLSFALSVAAIMLAEQALLNAAVLTVDATASDAALAGIVFNVFLITRAPLQLFQAVQTSLLPHLAGLEATEGHAAFARAIRTTVLAIAAFAGAVALGLLAIGPFVMSHVFGQDFEYGRLGLMVVAAGMGLHLVAGTLNQAALARGRAGRAAAAWGTAAAAFVVWTLLPVIGDHVLRVEVGYALGTGLLCVLLAGLYRSGSYS